MTIEEMNDLEFLKLIKPAPGIEVKEENKCKYDENGECECCKDYHRRLKEQGLIDEDGDLI